MSAVVQDLRRAIVLFKNAPAFACVGIVTLALGIGVNTAIFSLVEAILWQPLQAHNPNRLVTLYTSGSHGIGYSPTSYPDYEYYRDHANVLSGLAAYARIRMTWSDTDQPEFSWAELVSTNYFDVLGIQPVIGRSFLAEDDTRSVIVVSHHFWRAHLGSNSHLIGTTLLLNGRSFTIVGIAPRNFEGIVLDWGSPPEFWIPIGMHREVLRAGGHGDFRRDHHARWLLLTGRLRDGATLSECRAEENVLAKQLGNSFPEPESEGGRTVIALPLKEARFWPTWRSSIVMVLSLLAGAAALVLFIACFNIAILLLVGASVRRKEFATRLALGASRARLIRQLLTENLVFTGAGTVLGLLVAYWMMGILPRFQLPFAIPLTFNLRIDTDVLLFATVLAFVSVLLSGLLSALHATKSDLSSSLKEGAIERIAGGRRMDTRRVLIVCEIALTTVSLVSAGLLFRSLRRIESASLGFNPQNTLVLGIDVSSVGYSEKDGLVFYKKVLDRVSGLPGVQAASLSQHRPLGLSRSNARIFREGQDDASLDAGIDVETNVVSPGYFGTLGIPILQGRDFSAEDDRAKPKVVIVNKTMATTLWPQHDALGKRVRFAGEQSYREIVGVIEDVKYHAIWDEPEPYLYTPLSQDYIAMLSLYVHLPVDQNVGMAGVRNEIRSLDKRVPLFDAQTLQDQVVTSVSQRSTIVVLTSFFGLLALMLASVGLYGVIAYSVNQRKHEIAIRLAVGADRADILWLTISDGLSVTMMGLTIGLVAALGITRMLGVLLYGMRPTDASTYIGVSLLLGCLTSIATYIPAIRATRIDPASALKCE